MIAGIHRMDGDLTSASEAKEKDPKQASSEVDSASGHRNVNLAAAQRGAEEFRCNLG